ncbi:MAG: SPOR domain-containing protein [Paraburkholderia sp.]|jgi:DedD protein
MGIFSFGKKDDAPTRRGANTSSTRAARGERVERRTRRTERPDADAMLLDPTLPEKQRARRRLVGAIAMVVAAVVILPMVLDSHPKPVTDDIAIDIPNRPAPKAAADDEDTQAGVAPDNPAPDSTANSSLAASGVAPAPAAPATANAMTQQGAVAASAGKTSKPHTPVVAANTSPATPTPAPAKPAKPVKTPSAPIQSAANPSANDADSTGTGAADADSGTPASPPGSRFAVQLGAFPDDASAKAWASKLKAAGVPAYTERRKQVDGTTQTLLRAGPFADRAAATAAIAKVRAAGLTSSSNNGSAQ